MADCERIQGCRFFNEHLGAAPQVVVEGYKTRFCRTDNSRCARYVVADVLGTESVPADLGPNESLKAMDLLKDAGHDRPSRYFL